MPTNSKTPYHAPMLDLGWVDKTKSHNKQNKANNERNTKRGPVKVSPTTRTEPEIITETRTSERANVRLIDHDRTRRVWQGEENARKPRKT